MQKKIIIALVVIVLSYFSFYIDTVIKYYHRVDWELYKEYLWMFNKPVTNYLIVGRSSVGKNDVYNSFTFKNHTVASIWEFKSLKSLNLDNVSINPNGNLNDVKVSFHEIINNKNNPSITIKYGFEFDNSFNVNLDERSEIFTTIDSTNYKGFYGIINRMSFSDDDGEHLILYNYPKGKIPTLFIVYKTVESFYVLTLKSDMPFDESAIKMFNLK